ncbi:uncharacterized protein LOC111912009 [Lactuca sativa]|nr:uncharacterized protein LOC111912009 [Lactuca sativa]XP_023763536.1 uncharacterized protein LOC111912009 [Lactuca sativa]XP_052621295.1 uncharacterized protein LOC111912009 [Lactuca sativa]
MRCLGFRYKMSNGCGRSLSSQTLPANMATQLSKKRKLNGAKPSSTRSYLHHKLGVIVRPFSSTPFGNEIIGINLGTTNSCVSVMERKEKKRGFFLHMCNSSSCYLWSWRRKDTPVFQSNQLISNGSLIDFILITFSFFKAKRFMLQSWSMSLVW